MESHWAWASVISAFIYISSLLRRGRTRIFCCSFVNPMIYAFQFSHLGRENKTEEQCLCFFPSCLIILPRTLSKSGYKSRAVVTQLIFFNSPESQGPWFYNQEGRFMWQKYLVWYIFYCYQTNYSGLIFIILEFWRQVPQRAKAQELPR